MCSLEDVGSCRRTLRSRGWRTGGRSPPGRPSAPTTARQASQTASPEIKMIKMIREKYIENVKMTKQYHIYQKNKK